MLLIFIYLFNKNISNKKIITLYKIIKKIIYLSKMKKIKILEPHINI